MAEYIAREALDAEIRRQIDECKPMSDGRFYGASFLATIECAPAADVARVVRCKDCCYWNRKYTTVGECEKLADRDQEGGAQFDCDTEDDDFCSYGKRKENT